MDAATVITKVLWGLVNALGVWAVCVLLCTRTWVQRQVFYAHNTPIWLGQQLSKIESFGFVRNQITPFYIPTKDGHRLYTWLVMPLQVYAKHETILQQDRTLFGDVRERVAFSLLADNTTSRLIIYFHGNAGTLGQTRRTDAYRMISFGASDSIYILAFDYRGFGKSTGSPTEAGLTQDSIDVIRWAIEVANVPANRIVLVAHSLGTSLACAAAHHFVHEEPKVEFAGIVLCATFRDAASVFLNYSIGGFVPLFAPFGMSTRFRTWFFRHMTDTWNTADRITHIVRKTTRLRLTFVHATNDAIIPWTQADHLFHLAIDALEDEIMGPQLVTERRQTIDLGEGGWTHSWGDDQKLIQLVIVKYGGHNGIMKFAPVAIAALKSFGIDRSSSESSLYTMPHSL